MAKFAKPFNNFQFGQVSPKFMGRFDTQEYQSACETLQNAFVGEMGGVFTRPGSEVINEIPNSGLYAPSNPPDPTKDVMMFPMELENGTVHFFGTYKDYPIILEDGSTGDHYEGLIPMSVNFPGTRDYQIEIVSNPLDLPDLPSSSQLSLPFEYGKWQYVQYGKTLFVTHSSGRQKPFVVTVQEDTVPLTLKFQYLTNFRLPFDGSGGHGATPPDSDVLKRPYQDPNITATTLAPSATSGSITITSSVSNVLKVGYVYKITHGSTTGAAMVTSLVSSTQANATVIVNFGGTAASDDWQESAWGTNNWPKTFTVFEQRLFAGGSPESPDTVWGTVQNNVYNWMARKLTQDTSTNSSGLNYFGDLAATDAFSFRPASQQLNEIRWLMSGRSLAIGTARAEYIADGGGDAIGPLSVRAKAQTFYGGGYAQASQAGIDMLYSTSNGKKLRTFRYSDDNGSYISKDISTFAQVVQGRIDQIAWNPDHNLIWVVDTEGNLSSATYSDNYSRIAWCPQPLGGDHTVLSVYATESDVYVLLKRSGHFLIEKMDMSYEPTDLSDLKYLDSYEESAVGANFTSLNDWKDGEEVYAFFDGRIYGPYTVGASGAISGLPDALNGETALFGYGYQLQGVTLPLEAGGEYGPGTGQMMRVDTVTARLYKSFGGKIRGNESSNQDSFDTGTELFTDDDSEIRLSQSPTRKNQVYFESDIGFPLNILALIFNGVNNVK